MFLFYFSCINCESINESGARFGAVDSFLCLVVEVLDKI